jgi:AcrR family transcriptional regulator
MVSSEQSLPIASTELRPARSEAARGERQEVRLEPERPVRLRADAIRNRARVLAAAERLFATSEPAQVTMEDIARAAGVGRATLYRRYRSPAAVATALLDEHERNLQAAILRGDQPLGPVPPGEAAGAHPATPADRLAAFYAAMIDLLERHLHLVLGAEMGPARFRTGAYGFWRAHVRTLLSESNTPDTDVMVDTLLAPLAPDLYQFQRQRLGLPREQIKAGLARLAHSVLDRH